MFVSPAFAQIYHVKDMNTEQIKALDQGKTVVLLPGGPSFVDGRLGDKIPPSAEPSIDGKTFTQQNQEIERKQRDG